MISETTKGRWLALVLVLLLLVGTGVATYAQSGDGFDLSWWSVGGGQRVEGGGFSLLGMAGQPNAGPVLSGGGYRLGGGFLPAQGPARYGVYLPVTLRAW